MPKTPTPAQNEIDRFTATLAALRADIDTANRRAAQAQQVARQAASLARGTADVSAAATEATRSARAKSRDVTAEAAQARIRPEPVRTRVGDDGPTAELILAVEALIRERPLLLRDLIEETGARTGRVSGAIEALKKKGGVVDLGSGGRAVWFIPSPEVLARLRAK